MHNNSFSYSMLSTALRCNRLYQHLFIDKLVSDEPESINLHFGTALHTGLNSLLEGGDSSSFSLYWDSMRNTSFGTARHGWESLNTMGEVFLERFERLHLKHLKPLQAEQRLYGFSPNGVRLEGTPDFIGSYRGTLTVLDFKTASSRYPDGKIQASDQLLLYTYLAQQCLKIEIQQIGYVVFIKTKEPSIQTQLMAIDQANLKARIANIELQCKELLGKPAYTQNFNACFDMGKRCGFWKKCHGG